MDEVIHEATEFLTRETRRGSARFPAPISVADGLATPDPSDGWIIDGVVPRGGNVLQIGYPKSMKSIGYFDLAAAAALDGQWLGRFPTTGDLRVGIVMMEGRPRFALRMLERLARGRGRCADDLTDRLHFWHRPPLRLSDPKAMRGLGRYCADRELDLLILDAFGYAAHPGTNTNSDQEVLEQLQAFSALRDTAPGLTTWMVHHARKEQKDNTGARLTDLVRGSGAFGQWYDAGLVFFRKDERSPVSVRTEFRERTALEPFAFLAEDEFPAEEGGISTGWLRLVASDRTPRQIEQDEKVAAIAPLVVEFLRANPGASTTAIREGVGGANTIVDLAVEHLKRANKVVVDVGGAGRPTRHSLSGGYRA